MARERYLVGVNLEELKPEEKVEVPLTFGQKLQKLWYNYKIAIILCVGVVILTGIVAWIFATREKYDYTLVTVTKTMLTENAKTELMDEIVSYGEDLDGDGEVRVQIVALDMSDPAEYVQLAGIFSGGSSVFFAMEPKYYEEQIAVVETEDEHYFVKLGVKHEGISENGRYWNWKGSAAQTCMVSPMPSDWYFGVRLPIGTASGCEKESAECVALLEKWISNSPIGEANS